MCSDVITLSWNYIKLFGITELCPGSFLLHASLEAAIARNGSLSLQRVTAHPHTENRAVRPHAGERWAYGHVTANPVLSLLDPHCLSSHGDPICAHIPSLRPEAQLSCELANIPPRSTFSCFTLNSKTASVWHGPVARAAVPTASPRPASTHPPSPTQHTPESLEEVTAPGFCDFVVLFLANIYKTCCCLYPSPSNPTASGSNICLFHVLHIRAVIYNLPF